MFFCLLKKKIVAKPFASVFSDELLNGEVHLASNFVKNTVDETHRIALIFRIATKLHGCPDRVNEIYDLYGGTKAGQPPSLYDPAVSIDACLEVPLVSSLDLNVDKIGRVVSFNSFEPKCVRPWNDDEIPDQVGHKAAAQYTLPSLFNHACQSNANWVCFGDVMVIRAIRAIPKGVEITIPYAGGLTASDRAKKLKPFLEGRACDCLLCGWDESDGDQARRKRAELWQRWTQSGRGRLETSGLEGKELIEGVIDQVKMTYNSESKRSVRLELFHLHLEAMQFLATFGAQTGIKNLYVQAITHGCQALECAGFLGLDASVKKGSEATKTVLPFSKKSVGSPMTDPDLPIAAMIFLSRCFANINDLVRAESWFRASWWSKSCFLCPLYAFRAVS